MGALEAAWKMTVMTGGTAPKGWRTHFGPKPELGHRYGLVEDSSPSYPPRTKKNVQEADGTAIIASNLGSPGCSLTSRYVAQAGKPLFTVQLHEDYTNDWLKEQAVRLTRWVIENRIYVLNVAGNRDKFGSFHHHATEKCIDWMLLNLYHRGLLVTDNLQLDNE